LIFVDEAGRRCVLLLCGDHDPGGLHITDKIRKNLSDLSGTVGWTPENLIISRFGLNADFIDRYGLTWIDNLETSSGQQLDDAEHSDREDRSGRSDGLRLIFPRMTSGRDLARRWGEVRDLRSRPWRVGCDVDADVARSQADLLAYMFSGLSRARCRVRTGRLSQHREQSRCAPDGSSAFPSAITNRRSFDFLRLQDCAGGLVRDVGVQYRRSGLSSKLNRDAELS
jgi:hypothetical protein